MPSATLDELIRLLINGARLAPCGNFNKYNFMLSLKEAETIYCYLINKKMEFCFYDSVLISRDYCRKVIQGQSLTNILTTK